MKGAPAPAMALGSNELKAVDLMQAYSVFANGGIKKEAHAIRRIVDQK